MKIGSWFPSATNPTAYTFPNNGLILDRVPADIQEKLNKDINEIALDFESQEKYNNTLAGHIQREYGMVKSIPILSDYVLGLARLHEGFFNYRVLSELSTNMELDYDLSSLWVNFQRKNEFNPPHTHTGVYSFVIWMKLPYDLEEERKLFPDMAMGDKASANFNLYVTDILGRMQCHTVELDKSKEGCICLFPSAMYHSVNPFYTSDDYRISIAGNIYLKPLMRL